MSLFNKINIKICLLHHLMTSSVVLQEDTFLRIYETRMLPKMVCCGKLNEVNTFFCIYDNKYTVEHCLPVQQEMPLLLADRRATRLHLRLTVSTCLTINDFICL